MIQARLILALLAIALLTAQPAYSQIPVFDGALVAQQIRLVSVAYQVYKQVAEQTDLLKRQNLRLPVDRLERYRVDPIANATHDLEAAPYGRAILAGLDAGDARGALYRQLITALPPLNDARLPPAARRAVRAGYAAAEISDAIAMRGINQVGAVRVYTSGELKAAIDAVVEDILHPRTAFHYLGARADTLTGAALVELRQQQVENQLASHQLEAQLVAALQRRDVEAVHHEMRLGQLQQDTRPGTSIADAIRQASRQAR